MILFDASVKKVTLPGADEIWITPCSILEPVSGVAGHDRLTIGLTSVDHNPLELAMPLECLAQEPYGGSEIALLVEPELDRAAVAVGRPVEVSPTTSDFDIRFINMPLASDPQLLLIEPL